MTDTQAIAERIEQRLREALAPERLTVHDDSPRHAGHAGSRDGGYFRVEIVSARFAGLSRVGQHRLVYEALAGMFGTEIHALELRTLPPSPAT